MGKMASNNFRARKLVHMVVNTDVCHDNSVRNTELSTSTLTIEIEPEDTKKSEDEIFTDRQDIASSQDVVNADFSLNLSSAALGDIRVSDYSFSKDESFGLLCNETLTHSLMGSPVADFGTEDEPTTSQGLQEIENQRSNESCPDVDNAPTTSNNQILVTDSVMQNEDNEAANRLVCDALKGTTKKGTPRIRKLYTESTNTRKEAKKQKKIEKFCVKPACTTSCKKKCGEKFSESDRNEVPVHELPSEADFLKRFRKERAFRCNSAELTNWVAIPILNNTTLRPVYPTGGQTHKIDYITNKIYASCIVVCDLYIIAIIIGSYLDVRPPNRIAAMDASSITLPISAKSWAVEITALIAFHASAAVVALRTCVIADDSRCLLIAPYLCDIGNVHPCWVATDRFPQLLMHKCPCPYCGSTHTGVYPASSSKAGAFTASRTSHICAYLTSKPS
ncbi:hypothetical protein HW555_012694 [Spodoptera exigua]|uniref:Uncharacterized protein n=1 Tax=Spodoptera exigua TaxID=7107 RepID=A0A835G6M2_SPOEX|nr:hypothetical protein HW555_012694 [Spodoptera exigua]